MVPEGHRARIGPGIAVATLEIGNDRILALPGVRSQIEWGRGNVGETAVCAEADPGSVLR